MGPLVPEIFSNEFNFVIALVIGFFFGFILEQAGFSSSKKLAGLFYGYDFVVLRVFFTAGVTAMIGVVLFGYWGWLDLSLIYINPTFLYSAILGGVIMGAGFIIGGFCPGTSIAAAAIGKIDAMVFIVGTVIGVFIFGEFFESFEPIFNAYNLGEWKIYDAIGVQSGTFVFLMTTVALAAFIFTTIIENKVNKTEKSTLPFFKQEKNQYIPFAVLFVAVSAVIAFLPTRQEAVMTELREELRENKASAEIITHTELAYKIIKEDSQLMIIDLRPINDTLPKALPGARRIPFDKLLSKEGTDLIKKTYKTIAFTDLSGELSKKAVIYAREIGNERAVALAGGIYLFFKEYDKTNIPSAAAINAENHPTINFKREVIFKLDSLYEKYANMNKPPAKENRKKSGGC